jgi:Methyltransferase domain
MTRTEVINCFVRRRQYRSYLEIGVGTGRENLERVQCEHKHGIDPAADVEGVQHVDSDTFVGDAIGTFDVIFIDGIHDEHQVDRDIANSLHRLNPGGVIILHDCLPPDEWHQRPSCDYRPGENWNGTVWKSVLKYFAVSDWRCYVVNCDWGCGVIDTTCGADASQHRELPMDLDYRRDFWRLGDYVLGEARFLMQLYNVAAFYHIAAMGSEPIIQKVKPTEQESTK